MLNNLTAAANLPLTSYHKPAHVVIGCAEGCGGRDFTALLITLSAWRLNRRRKRHRRQRTTSKVPSFFSLFLPFLRSYKSPWWLMSQFFRVFCIPHRHDEHQRKQPACVDVLHTHWSANAVRSVVPKQSCLMFPTHEGINSILGRITTRFTVIFLEIPAVEALQPTAVAASQLNN